MFEKVYPNLKRDGEVGKSGKIMLMRVLNPRRPMEISHSGEFLHQGHPPCPIPKVELLKDPSLFEKENIRSNPNCFTNGVEELARFKKPESTNVIEVILIFFLLNFRKEYSKVKKVRVLIHFLIILLLRLRVLQKNLKAIFFNKKIQIH